MPWSVPRFTIGLLFGVEVVCFVGLSVEEVGFEAGALLTGPATVPALPDACVVKVSFEAGWFRSWAT
jgi:hypothetical protein